VPEAATTPSLPRKRRPRKRPKVRPIGLDSHAAAAYVGVSRSLFLSLVSSGDVAPLPVRIGHRKVWNRLELKHWLASGAPHRNEWKGGIS
jgi:predicted DNA-binding transcriptional regulator AlpA